MRSDKIVLAACFAIAIAAAPAVVFTVGVTVGAFAEGNPGGPRADGTPGPHDSVINNAVSDGINYVLAHTPFIGNCMGLCDAVSAPFQVNPGDPAAHEGATGYGSDGVSTGPGEGNAMY